MQRERLLTRSRLRAAVALALVVAVACATGSTGGVSSGVVLSADDDTWARELCQNIPGPWLDRMLNAYRPDWSGDVQYLPQYPNPVDGALAHAGPWEHLQRVPLLVYGPGFVRTGTHQGRVRLVDVAPTIASLVDFDLAPTDGRPLPGALLSAEERRRPRLIVTLVWDSGGMNVLQEWPDAWPFLRSLIQDGAWFGNAMVDIANSNTPPGHAAIGTGALPPTTGFVDVYVEFGGQLLYPAVPRLLLWPTFADLYDFANGNAPVVGSVATLASQSMMMSHGSLWNGGDRDISVMRQGTELTKEAIEADEWNLPGELASFYRLPPYVNDVSTLAAYAEELDRADGRLDGLWRDNSIAQLRSGFDTPARTPFQTDIVEAVIQREDFGQDDVSDLLYLNYRAIDSIGHAFGLTSPEMLDAIRYQDRALRDLVGILDRDVGEDRWVLVLTADHGAQYPAEVSGGIPIDPNNMRARLLDTFDDDGDEVDLFLKIRPTQLWVDRVELADNDVSLDEIARFIGDLTASEVARSDFVIPPGRGSDRVYQAAFPSRLYQQLPCRSTDPAA